jgi:NPCBM/NEW2 domain
LKIEDSNLEIDGGQNFAAHKPEARAKDGVPLRLRFRLVCITRVLRRLIGRVLSIFNFQFFVAVFLLLRVPLQAQDLSLPLFDLHTANGTIASGPLAQVHEDWSVSLSGKNAIQVNGSRVVALRQCNAALPPPPRDQHVLLTNGDQIPGTPLQLTGERVRFKAAQIGAEAEWTLPLSAIAFLWFVAPDGVEDGEAFCRRLAAERRTRDLVLLRNGDRVEGTVTALDPGMVQLDTGNGRQIKVAHDKLAALALSTELARSLRTKGVYGRLVLINGARLSLLSARADGQTLVGKTLFGATVQLAVKQIVALDLRQGCAVYLSDLKPRRYLHTPYLSVRWPYTFDTNVAGIQMRVGGSTYDKGIGMHSESRLTFELDGSYKWFEAWVGLDDRTGREGSALIQVLVDGKPGEFGEAKELTGPGQPLPVRVSVAGARELTLVVLFGRRGDVQDHVDWADARLIK